MVCSESLGISKAGAQPHSGSAVALFLLQQDLRNTGPSSRVGSHL